MLRAVAAFAVDAAAVFGQERESCLAFAENLVPGSQLTTDPPKVLRLPLLQQGNQSCTLRVCAAVSHHPSSPLLASLETQVRLPRFAAYQFLPYSQAAPLWTAVLKEAASHAAGEGSSAALALSSSSSSSSATGSTRAYGTLSLSLPDRTQRAVLWIGQSFILPPDAAHGPTSFKSQAGAGVPSLSLSFRCSRTGSLLRMEASSEQPGSTFTITCDSLDLAGELVQDLAAYLNIRELETVAVFPSQLEAFKRNTLDRLELLQSQRVKQTGDSAAGAAAVRTLVVRAEDARLLGDLPGVRRFYGELRGLQSQLLGEYERRAASQAALTAVLKEVNKMIETAANLRGEWRGRGGSGEGTRLGGG